MAIVGIPTNTCNKRVLDCASPACIHSKGTASMKPLSKSTEGFTDSVIRRMTRVALQYGAVNLSQGFPDFDPPQELLDRLAQVAYEGPH